jgi:hypothetical protein
MPSWFLSWRFAGGCWRRDGSGCNGLLLKKGRCRSSCCRIGSSRGGKGGACARAPPNTLARVAGSGQVAKRSPEGEAAPAATSLHATVRRLRAAKMNRWLGRRREIGA